VESTPVRWKVRQPGGKYTNPVESTPTRWKVRQSGGKYTNPVESTPNTVKSTPDATRFQIKILI
jgi:hypothetical protein